MSTRKVSGKTWIANWKFAKSHHSAEDYFRKATHGHCPLCGKLYTIKDHGTLRKHTSNDPRCFLEPQLPAEIVQAIFLIGDLE